MMRTLRMLELIDRRENRNTKLKLVVRILSLIVPSNTMVLFEPCCVPQMCPQDFLYPVMFGLVHGEPFLIYMVHSNFNV